MRQLHMPLQRVDTPVSAAPGGLVDWANCVRGSRQACLLVGIDGHLIALSETARACFGDAARPGVAETMWWLEEFPQSPAPAFERSLLARAAASGAPGHSVVQLRLRDAIVMVQVLVAPLETTGRTDALLVFIRPVAAVSPQHVE